MRGEYALLLVVSYICLDYPHMRGEYGLPGDIFFYRMGLPPHAWGI